MAGSTFGMTQVAKAKIRVIESSRGSLSDAQDHGEDREDTFETFHRHTKVKLGGVSRADLLKRDQLHNNVGDIFKEKIREKNRINKFASSKGSFVDYQHNKTPRPDQLTLRSGMIQQVSSNRMFNNTQSNITFTRSGVNKQSQQSQNTLGGNSTYSNFQTIQNNN